MYYSVLPSGCEVCVLFMWTSQGGCAWQSSHLCQKIAVLWGEFHHLGSSSFKALKGSCSGQSVLLQFLSICIKKIDHTWEHFVYPPLPHWHSLSTSPSLTILQIEMPSQLGTSGAHPHHPFISRRPSVWACMRLFRGFFYIKMSPSFKAKLGFLELLNPERQLTHSFFFFWWVLMPWGNLFKAPLYSSGTQGGQRKWGWKLFLILLRFT